MPPTQQLDVLATPQVGYPNVLVVLALSVPGSLPRGQEGAIGQASERAHVVVAQLLRHGVALAPALPCTRRLQVLGDGVLAVRLDLQQSCKRGFGTGPSGRERNREPGIIYTNNINSDNCAVRDPLL